MACEFDLNIRDTADAFLDRAQVLAQKMNGKFEGSTASGNFNIPTALGSISGTYSTTNAQVHIVVTDKPIFMGCDMIADLLRKKLE